MVELAMPSRLNPGYVPEFCFGHLIGRGAPAREAVNACPEIEIKISKLLVKGNQNLHISSLSLIDFI